MLMKYHTAFTFSMLITISAKLSIHKIFHKSIRNHEENFKRDLHAEHLNSTWKMRQNCCMVTFLQQHSPEYSDFYIEELHTSLLPSTS